VLSLMALVLGLGDGASGSPGAGAVAVAVEIAVVGDEDDLRRVRALVEPRPLGGAATRWRRVERFAPEEVLGAGARQPGAALRCWVDLGDPRRARLTFASPSGERFLVREVALSGRFDEIDRQSLAQVLELSVTALVEDERAGISRAEAEALLRAPVEAAAPATARAPPGTPAPAPQVPAAAAATTPPPEAPAPSRLGLGAFYAADARGAEMPIAHGPGLALEWGRGGPSPGLGAFLEGQLQLPDRATSDRIAVGFTTVAARAGLGGRWPLGGRGGGERRGLGSAELDVRAGVGADFVRISPERGAADGSAMLTAARWSQSLVVTGAVGVAVAAGPRIGLALRGYVAYLPTAVHYDLAVDGGTVAVFSPWRLRPGLALAVMWLR
jgi:hypothetical protein